MAQSKFKLTMQLGAATATSFRRVIKGSETELGRLGSSIDKLKNKQAAINKFELSEAGFGKARATYNSATKELGKLRREMFRNGPPTKQQIKNVERAKQKVERLSVSLEKQKSSLQSARRELDKTGLSTKNLINDNVRLGGQIDKLTSKFKKLSAARDAQAKNRARQSELRGQVFDAAAIGFAIAQPLKTAIDFEQSTARLGAITNTTKDDKAISEFRDKAKLLGRTTQFTASESAKAMTFLGMAGLKTQDILDATPGVLDLAAASGSDLARTSDIASNILSGFSLKADQMGRVGDVLTETFTSSNTTLESLGETMKFAAPVASAVGASIEQVAAMAGLLGDVGIQGSMAGTALRASFLRLSAPPRMAADAIAELGLQVKDEANNLRPLPILLKEISEATADLGTAERAEAIKKIFGQEAAAGATELVKQAGLGALDKEIAKLESSKTSGRAKAVAKDMNDTTAGSLKRLGSALESISISVGSLLLPTIAAGADMFATMASGISLTAEKFPFLTKLIVGATVGLVGLRIVTLSSMFAFTFLKGSVLSLVTAYRVLAGTQLLVKLNMIRLNALAAITAVRTGIVTAAQWGLNLAMSLNPIGFVVLGISALIGIGVALVKFWEPISGFFINMWDSIKESTGSSVGWLLNTIGLIIAPFKILGKVWEFASGFFDDDNENPVSKNDNKRKANQVVGAAVAGQSSLAAPIATADATPQIEAVSPRLTSQQTNTINAPITINTTPDMDENAVANVVKKELSVRQAEIQTNQNGFLFDAS